MGMEHEQIDRERNVAPRRLRPDSIVDAAKLRRAQAQMNAAVAQQAADDANLPPFGHDPVAAANDDFDGDITEALDLAEQNAIAEIGQAARAANEKPAEQTVPDIKTMVKRHRARMQGELDGLTKTKAFIEQRIAKANARCEERNKAAIVAFEAEKAAAIAEQVAELTDADADLAQIAACREAIDLAVGRLNKAEPK